MTRQMTGIQKGGYCPLGKGRAFQIIGFFDHCQARDKRFRSHNPAQSQGGGQNLGKGADIEDPLPIKRLKWRRRVTVIAQEAIGIIL